MSPLKIIIFGGKAEQINDIFQWISPKYDLRHYPLAYQLNAADLSPLPALIIVIDNANEKKTIHKVGVLQKKMINTPVLLLTEHITQSCMLSLFRTGVKDILIYPLNKEEFIKKAQQYAKENPEQRSSSFSIVKSLLTIRFWYKTLLRWLFPSKAPIGILADQRYAQILKEETSSAFDLDVQFLGGLSVEVRGKKIRKLPGKKVNSLLAYLLYNHKKPIHRDILMERFWGETSPSSARNSLNVAIHTIRKHFTKTLPQQDLLIYKNECYSINTDLDIRTDVEQFAAYFQKGSIMEQNQGLEHALGAYNKAVALYRGDFMEDMLYEEWCEAVRDNLKETFLLILDRQSNFFFEQSSYSVAITICKKMLEKDPCLEEVHRKLIVCYKQLGQQDKAIKQFYKCAQSLQEELGLAPSEETKALLEQLRKRG